MLLTRGGNGGFEERRSTGKDRDLQTADFCAFARDSRANRRWKNVGKYARKVFTNYILWIFCGGSNFLFGFTLLSFICKVYEFTWHCFLEKHR